MNKLMKKVMSIMILPVMLLVGGCFKGEITDIEGKIWAEENGYVKAEDNSIVGTYEFEYTALVDEEENETQWIVYSCSVLNGVLVDNATMNRYKESCQDYAVTTIEFNTNGIMTIKEPGRTLTWEYKLNEEGELLLAPLETDVENNAVEGVFNKVSACSFKNNRFYYSNSGVVNGVGIVGVFTKK